MPTTDLEYAVICSHSINKIEKEVITMIAITDKEEKNLDSGLLICDKGNQHFCIHSDEIICYGEIDFNTASDDYYSLENMKWLDYLDYKGISIPADYDYEEHACYPPSNFIRYTETFNPAVLAQYLHGRLGKPQRVCIFKEKINAKRT